MLVFPEMLEKNGYRKSYVAQRDCWALLEVVLFLELRRSALNGWVNNYTEKKPQKGSKHRERYCRCGCRGCRRPHSLQTHIRARCWQLAIWRLQVEHRGLLAPAAVNLGERMPNIRGWVDPEAWRRPLLEPAVIFFPARELRRRKSAFAYRTVNRPSLCPNLIAVNQLTKGVLTMNWNLSWSRRMRWAGRIARTEQIRNAHMM
jgi:hypothetical protein